MGDIFSTHLRTPWKSLQLYLARAAGQFQLMRSSLVSFHVVCCQRYGILPPQLADWFLPDDRGAVWLGLKEVWFWFCGVWFGVGMGYLWFGVV